MTGFIEQALVFIGSSLILVPIFQKLRFGSVLGYLIAGIIVGPAGLRLIEHSESVIHFAELGVVLLLFLIGLEIQPHKLWSMRKHLLGLGGVQIALSAAVFWVAGIALGLNTAAAGVIAFAMSLSSTAFAIQTLIDRNQFSTEFGRSSFSILLMQDLVAIPALAFIPLLGNSNASTAPTLSGVLSVVGLMIALIAVSRFLIRPAFRVIAETRAREMFTAATLFIVLGVATLMQKAGLSAALGSFLAGVLLADSEYRHELEADLEPFKGLLMGLFFIGVGMGVNLDLVLSRPLSILALTISYLAVKTAVVYIAGRIFKMTHENSKRMALTIAQGGEFAFVIFGLVLHIGLGQSETIALLTVVITFSMMLSPVLSIANDWFTRSNGQTAQPEYDEIKGEEPEVILAGFGRFGQIFGRVLRSQNIPFVAVDHDSGQVELVRRFGNKCYYGDVSRIEILQAAGAARAKYFVLAVDDVEVSLATAKTVRESFPHLKIFARARNRGHVFELMEVGVERIKRETFESSLTFAGELLVELGIPVDRANDFIEHFRRHDEIMIREQFKVRDDDKMFVSVSKQGAAQLADVLTEDRTRTYVEQPR